ncbi:hypothetical protein HY793_03595 [Candidatus Desantisbacteria bacterium]|nr:hypothetical protein [Candidatus Desantisbacteria bacterium]
MDINEIRGGKTKMNMVENIKKVVQELILPELGIIKAEKQEIKTILQLIINQRVNDTNVQLVDQNRRIDELRVELKEEIAKNTIRMDRLYEIIVRRDEHEMLVMRVSRIEQKQTEMDMEFHKIAA